MKRKIATAIGAAALALAALAAGPAPLPGAPIPSPLIDVAAAATTKSLGGGGGDIGAAGDRIGELLSGWAVYPLIAVAGYFLITSLVARNIGAAVGVVLITLVGLIFFTSPQSIVSAAQGIAGIVF